jgi:hypothetical protein
LRLCCPPLSVRRWRGHTDVFYCRLLIFCKSFIISCYHYPAPPWEAIMSSTVLHLFTGWSPLLTHFIKRMTTADFAPQDHVFAPTDVARLHGLTAHERADTLDDQTWSDLLLDRYSERLSVETSILGRQALYRRLRNGIGGEEAALRRTRIETLLADRTRLDGLHHTLRALRHADTEAAGLLFDPASVPPVEPGWLRAWWLIPLLLAASIAAALLLSPVAWAGTALAMYLLVAPQMRYREGMEAWDRQARALQMMLRVCSLMDGSAHPMAADFAGRGTTAGRISRRLAPSPLLDMVPFVNDYTTWFLLAKVRHYFKSARLPFEQRPFLRECYALCAELEADVALARHLLATPAWCWAQRSAPRSLALDGAVHPLVDGASALSIGLEGKGAFLSGQNGVGKSTFLRTLGLNLAAARAFGFCYARQASLPALRVVASMQNEDSLLGGQSLYIAELARARALLAAAADGGRPVVCLIDEIFRGTNHEESVSAAAAVLDELASRSLVVVSSHNLVLGPLLAHRLAPWRVARGPDGVPALEPGMLGRTNGIALLADRGFGQAVQDKAEKVARWLASQRGGGAGADLLDDAPRRA